MVALEVEVSRLLAVAQWWGSQNVDAGLDGPIQALELLATESGGPSRLSGVWRQVDGVYSRIEGLKGRLPDDGGATVEWLFPAHEAQRVQVRDALMDGEYGVALGHLRALRERGRLVGPALGVASALFGSAGRPAANHLRIGVHFPGSERTVESAGRALEKVGVWLKILSQREERVDYRLVSVRSGSDIPILDIDYATAAIILGAFAAAAKVMVDWFRTGFGSFFDEFGGRLGRELGDYLFGPEGEARRRAEKLFAESNPGVSPNVRAAVDAHVEPRSIGEFRGW